MVVDFVGVVVDVVVVVVVFVTVISVVVATDVDAFGDESASAS